MTAVGHPGGPATSSFPGFVTPPGRVAPVARRIRAYIGSEPVVDSTDALYVWESEPYPHYYFPRGDVAAEAMVGEDRVEPGPFGTVELYGLRSGAGIRPGTVKVLAEASPEQLAGTVRVGWDSVDSWYEEDEQVFVHPRNPYVRVDALRSTRTVEVQLEGVTLARAASAVMVFETGLPTRYYLDRTTVDFSRLVPSDTVTRCPYKGTTSNYWSVRLDGTVRADLAWSYDFPTRQLQPIAGLVAFYNDKVDIVVDGRLLDRAR